MKYSMMTYTMMRQKGFTPADCVRVAAELKMEGIDWVTTYGEDPALLKKMSEDAGLTVAAHTFFVPGNTLAEKISNAERSLDDACILGAPLVMIPPAPFAEVTDPAENRKRWIGILAEIAPLAEQRKLILTVENFPGSASGFVTADDFYEAQKVIPSLKLTFDNGNAATGEDQIESLKCCFKDVVHVHFKDWDILTESDIEWRKMRDGRYYIPALIGEGDIDSKATLRTLEELGYEGFINIEYENDKYPADEGIRRVLKHLRH